jgi:peptidoglycan-N-acetylglucosamine deacetylase
LTDEGLPSARPTGSAACVKIQRPPAFFASVLSLNPASPWPWPPLLRASVVLHGAALAMGVVWPAQALWIVAALMLNHALITACGLVPRCAWLGTNHRLLHASATQRREWALTIDDGPDPEVTPLVLDLLARHGVKATFFCIATRAAQHPHVMTRIAAEGHSVQNHSDVHAHHFSLWGFKRMAADIASAQQTLTRLVGTAPVFFRAPAGLRNPFLAPVLHQAGLQLVSWTRRGYDTQQANASRVLDRLLPALAPGAILLIHDGHSARGADGTPVVLRVLPALLAAAAQRQLRAVTLPQGLLAGEATHQTSHVLA